MPAILYSRATIGGCLRRQLPGNERAWAVSAKGNLLEEAGQAMPAFIIDVAHALPPRSVANDELPSTLETDPQGIFKKTGIRSRHWAEKGVYTSDLGTEAAAKLIARTRIDPRAIDCLIATTQTPDHLIPGIGVSIQAKLGLENIPCFDLRNQCSGFLYALQMARAFI